MRERPSLGTPFGTDGPWLGAILDVLADLHDLLDERLPRAGEGRPVKVNEPAPEVPAQGAVPVSEPAPDLPTRPAEPVAEPAPDEPDEDVPADLPEPPPRAGKGSGLNAWRAFADATGVGYEPDADRGDIIAACVDAGVIPAE
ncbi:hypothetical protein [Paractinoplanes ferrugineus]|uniref:hypothetical protein n=1 Tax=Paractinoplanes ferrugineus TaxID=113564 RepID=UPI001944FA69|nr:hypothetical protein [Actinoplanes ferrugineus]